MNKFQILERFINNLKMDFCEYQCLSIDLGRFTFDINNEDDESKIKIIQISGSYIESSSSEMIGFDPEFNSFFYQADPSFLNDENMSFFWLNRGLLDSLPSGLVEALRRIGQTGKSEMFDLSTNLLINKA